MIHGPINLSKQKPISEMLFPKTPSAYSRLKKTIWLHLCAHKARILSEKEKYRFYTPRIQLLFGLITLSDTSHQKESDSFCSFGLTFSNEKITLIFCSENREIELSSSEVYNRPFPSNSRILRSMAVVWRSNSSG